MAEANVFHVQVRYGHDGSWVALPSNQVTFARMNDGLTGQKSSVLELYLVRTVSGWKHQEIFTHENWRYCPKQYTPVFDTSKGRYSIKCGLGSFIALAYDQYDDDSGKTHQRWMRIDQSVIDVRHYESWNSMMEACTDDKNVGITIEPLEPGTIYPLMVREYPPSGNKARREDGQA